jgi:16S rRNA (guanine966-N2)-methyltransferase
LKIISGQYRGRKLATAKGHETRPPLEFLRSALFNILGKDIVDTRVLDIFAGSGSLGLEALSRGAKNCTFIEAGRNIQKILKQNIKNIGCEDKIEILPGRVPGVFSMLNEKGYDIIFIDPPFDALMQGQFLDIEDMLLPFLSEAGLVVIRHPENVPFLPENGLYEMVKEKKYGISILKFKRPFKKKE